jgi:diacylglycerol kinase family enzyme
MQYAIIANPKAGGLSVDQKRRLLAPASQILNADVHGLDTASASELAGCAVELSSRCDVLVVAGGDGTLSDIINAIYPSRLSLAYLPFGTGNAIRRTLAYRGGITDIARRIRNGRLHHYDLVRCDEKRLTFLASVGIDGIAVKLWTRYRQQGYSPKKAYFLASTRAWMRTYQPGRIRLTVDETEITVDKLLSLVVVPQPYFGLGMKIVPRAKWDDGRLHICCISSGWWHLASVITTSFTIGNRTGIYRSGTKAVVHSEKPLTLQIDGDLGWESDTFSFEVLPGILRMQH